MLLIDRIPKLQGKIFAQGESKPRAEAQRLGAVRNITVSELLAIERVKAKRNTVVQQIRLDKRKREPTRVLAIGQRRLGKQAASEEVTLGNTDFAERAVSGRIAARYREVAGGFLFEIDHQNHAIARGSRLGRDLHALEEIEVLQAALGAIDQRAVVRIALGNIEFAANHVIPGAGIAAHIDALDVGPRPLVDGKDD